MNKPLLAIFFTVGVFSVSCGAPDGARESSSDFEPVNQDAASSPVSGSEIATTQINVGDFVFDVRTAGPEEGEVVILLHGFPQTSYEWRDQLRALGAAGFRALAPAQRGYSAGARPDGIEPYAIPLLVGDVLGLADAVGVDRFHIVGHDWGAAVAWAIALVAPNRVITANPVSVPHPDAFSRVLNDPTSCQPEASGISTCSSSPIRRMDSWPMTTQTSARSSRGSTTMPSTSTYACSAPRRRWEPRSTGIERTSPTAISPDHPWGRSPFRPCLPGSTGIPPSASMELG